MSVQFQGYDVSGMTEFVIPEGIKEIAPDAFKDCSTKKVLSWFLSFDINVMMVKKNIDVIASTSIASTS